MIEVKYFPNKDTSKGFIGGGYLTIGNLVKINFRVRDSKVSAANETFTGIFVGEIFYVDHLIYPEINIVWQFLHRMPSKADRLEQT